MRRLFVPGYYSGFSNNKMSLDIAIVLAYFTGRTLVPYRFRLPRRAPMDAPPDRAVEPMSFWIFSKSPFPIPTSIFSRLGYPCRARASAYGHRSRIGTVLPAIPPTDDIRFRQFRNGRPYVYTVSEQEDDAPDLHIHTLTLGHYSYAFYLADAVVDRSST